MLRRCILVCHGSHRLCCRTPANPFRNRFMPYMDMHVTKMAAIRHWYAMKLLFGCAQGVDRSECNHLAALC